MKNEENNEDLKELDLPVKDENLESALGMLTDQLKLILGASP